MDVTSYLLGKKVGGGSGGGKYAPRLLRFGASSTSAGPYLGTELDYEIANLDTARFTDMQYMFANCSNLVKLDLSNFITNNVETMKNMFFGCSNLKEINLKNAEITNNEYMNNMFTNCSSLEKIDIRSMEFSKAPSNLNVTNMLNNVPTNCEIIVKNNTEKSWLENKFSSYTNIKVAN